jgi:hypothetical protein
MIQFRPNVTRVKNLSDRRRLPLLGKIRLGIKKKSTKTGNEYPAETDYFVCPEEVKAVFGDEPKSLKIMIPINDIDSVFPTSYTYYGSGKGVKCKGDGELAWFVNDSGDMEERSCPCEKLDQEKGGCKQVGRLLFMIPSVSVGGVYQISTSSYNSIIDIQSGLAFVEAMAGRFSMVDLELRREPTETHYDGKKQTHYTIRLTLPKDFSINDLQRLQLSGNQQIYSTMLALPEPVEENPVYDAADAVDGDIVDEADQSQAEDEPPPYSGDDWLDGMGSEPPPDELVTSAQLKKLATVMTKMSYTDRDTRMAIVNEWLEKNDKPKVESSKDLSKYDAMSLIDYLDGMLKKAEASTAD